MRATRRLAFLLLCCGVLLGACGDTPAGPGGTADLPAGVADLARALDDSGGGLPDLRDAAAPFDLAFDAGRDAAAPADAATAIDAAAPTDLTVPIGCDGGVLDRDAGACVECLRDGDCAGGGACCGRRCVDTSASPANCGRCGNACTAPNAAPLCKAGVCALGACNPGFADCNGQPGDGCEVGTSSDVKNCGGCGLTCALPHAMVGCVGGACLLAACDPGFRNCDGDPKNGCEIDADQDPMNCGGCGSSCAKLPNAAASCAKGACAIGACNAGFGNCDKMDGNGCETDVTASLVHCGACGNACPAPPNVVVTCAAGKCGTGGCVQGYADCDGNAGNGCEAKLTTDAKNCGACGNACAGNFPNGVPGCAAGKCGVTCNPGWGDCDGNGGNGCEKDVSSDAANCGACGNACKMGEACVMGVCFSCASGSYEGPASATALGFNVSGTISFTLGAPVNGVLSVTKGSVTMTGAMNANASATVGGSLDCNTKKFNGTLVNGTATALGLPPLPFTGSATGDYLGNPARVANGVLSAMGGLVANGTFTADWTGP